MRSNTLDRRTGKRNLGRRGTIGSELGVKQTEGMYARLRKGRRVLELALPATA